MNTQLPNCIPQTLHCTPIEPCPTINPPCPGQQQQAGAQGTAATVCTQQGCQGTAATVCTQQHCQPQAAQAQGGWGTHTYVFQTNCPPATVCAQPTTLCPPTIVCPQQQAYQTGAATVCTQHGCAQAQPGPTPTATYYPGCHTQGAQAGGYTRIPQCQPVTTLCIYTVNQCPQAVAQTQIPQCQPNTTLCIATQNCHTTHPVQCCLPWTVGPVMTAGPYCQG